jgi:hypothetical protein
MVENQCTTSVDQLGCRQTAAPFFCGHHSACAFPQKPLLGLATSKSHNLWDKNIVS